MNMSAPGLVGWLPTFYNNTVRSYSTTNAARSSERDSVPHHVDLNIAFWMWLFEYMPGYGTRNATKLLFPSVSAPEADPEIFGFLDTFLQDVSYASGAPIYSLVSEDSSAQKKFQRPETVEISQFVGFLRPFVQHLDSVLKLSSYQSIELKRGIGTFETIAFALLILFRQHGFDVKLLPEETAVQDSLSNLSFNVVDLTHHFLTVKQMQSVIFGVGSTPISNSPHSRNWGSTNTENTEAAKSIFSSASKRVLILPCTRLLDLDDELIEETKRALPNVTAICFSANVDQFNVHAFSAAMHRIQSIAERSSLHLAVSLTGGYNRTDVDLHNSALASLIQHHCAVSTTLNVDLLFSNSLMTWRLFAPLKKMDLKGSRLCSKSPVCTALARSQLDLIYLKEFGTGFLHYFSR
jgi:hypothetical protein